MLGRLRLFIPLHLVPPLPGVPRSCRRRLYQLFVSRGEKNPGRPWTLDGCQQAATARTRSEARAVWKKCLGVPRLPAGLTPQPA